MKIWLSSLLTEKSAIRKTMHPTRLNTIHSVLFILVTMPLALAIFPVLVVRRGFQKPLDLKVLRTETTFSFFILFMEIIRGCCSNGTSRYFVLVLDRWTHSTLSDIYGKCLGCWVIWRRGLGSFVQQALLLQPSFVVRCEVFDWRSLRRPFELSPRALEVPGHLRVLREVTLSQLGITSQRVVAFAVYTLDYDEERSPYKGYSLTQARMESVGSELVESVDFLSKEKISLVLLGSSESGKAIVPREFPRLSNFGDLGGPHEVAIASGCHYFWTDGVGALWLSFPFRRPVLFSNQHSLRVPKWGWSMNHIVVPVIFKDQSGRELTFREELSSRPPFSKRGDLIWIRNSPLEIAEAHKEMLARLDGSWKEDEEVVELRRRFESMFKDFPEFYPAQVSSYFLKHHSNLLD